MVASGWGRQEEWEMTVKGVSFGGNENVLKLTTGKIAKRWEYTQNP